jgi:hypothetical protein
MFYFCLQFLTDLTGVPRSNPALELFFGVHSVESVAKRLESCPGKKRK